LFLVRQIKTPGKIWGFLFFHLQFHLAVAASCKLTVSMKSMVSEKILQETCEKTRNSSSKNISSCRQFLIIRIYVKSKSDSAR
jgi:hypothetical protein